MFLSVTSCAVVEILELPIVSQASHTDDFHNSVNKDLKIAIFS